MMNIKRVIAGTLAGVTLLCASGCGRQSTRVAYNISKEADNFNVTRRLEVINARTDKQRYQRT